MIENCSVYLPTAEVNFQAAFPGGTSDAAPANKPTRYEYDTPQGLVQLNLKYAADNADHLEGLTGYIQQLENNPSEIDHAVKMVEHVEMFFGVILPEPVSAESEAFQSLLFLVEQQHGFMFVAESILDATGYLVGPMTYNTELAQPEDAGSAEDATSTEEAAGDDTLEQGVIGAVPLHIADRRRASVATLNSLGFTCAETLPHRRSNMTDTLRPSNEIAARLFAQMALFMWVAAPEEKATSVGIADFVANNSLAEQYTQTERQILQTERRLANTHHGALIGWHLENMWALAWICGFEPEPTFHNGQISSEITRAVLEYLPNLGGTIDGFLETRTLRSSTDVATKEDLFYCAHNAVRSAQLGSATVPNGFDPVNHGGAVQERRHSLTWALSPGVSWSGTDLST